MINTMQGQERDAMPAPRCSSRIIIAIAGRCGVGKDAVAGCLLGRLGFAANMKFAKPLKDSASVLFGLPFECFEEHALKDRPHAKLNGSTPRAVLQWLGTDVMQHGLRDAGLLPGVGRGFWARRLIGSIDALPPACDRIVISDMRFPHELEALRARYGDTLLSLKITRRMPDVAAPESLGIAHESESVVDTLDVDAVLVNDGTLEQLEEAAMRLIQRFITRAMLVTAP